MHHAEDAKALGLIDGVRDESAVMDSLRQRANSAAAQSQRGKKMTADRDGAAPAAVESQPRLALPTSAKDLRDAYPEAVAVIEKEALAAERKRVSVIADACKDQGNALMACGLSAIADGRDATDALVAMLKVRDVAPVSATAVSGSPTIDTLRAANAANKPLGVAPILDEPAMPASETQMKAAWDAMGPDGKAEFRDRFYIYKAACYQAHGLDANGRKVTN
jgi:hypothetical protein